MLTHLLMLAALSSSLGAGYFAPVQAPYRVLIPLRGQGQQLPLSCESRSAVDVAGFWKVKIAERAFHERLPKTDNPHTGFVGDVFGHWGDLPPNGYGVYAEPVAAVLRDYGLAAEARYGMGLEGLRSELASGRPVILWAYPRMATQPVETHVTSSGQSVAVIRYEHTVVAVGYSDDAVYVVDAANGHRWAYRNEALLTAWSKLGQMSVVVAGRADEQAAAENGRTSDLGLQACPSANLCIHEVWYGGETDGERTVEIRGTVADSDMAYYKFEIEDSRCENGACFISQSSQMVNGGTLTKWSARDLPKGNYLLRLVIVDQHGEASRLPARVHVSLN